MAPNAEVQAMLEEAGWLRGLAASLIGDAAQADDLVQDTWLAALKQPPRAAGEPRPWLARVVRNLARNTRRDRARRATHEELAHEERAHPGPDALAQQAEAQRLLADAVTRLAEPLRDAIVLRYFQGLDSSAAAARLGVPASTVRTRLQRALEELRSDLDRRHEGGREGWGLLLAPLVGRAPGATVSAPAAATAVASGAWSPALLAGAGALCVLAVGGAFYRELRRDPGVTQAALVTALLEESQAEAQETQGTREPSGSREPVEPAPAESGDGATLAPAELPLAGGAGAVLSGTILVDGRPPEWSI